MFNAVDFVYRTEDYSKFKKLTGNRDILESRKNLIISSIKDCGWIRNPIVVNDNMEIIDGQGRFEALRELGLPVEYVVASGATISDCIALNIKQTNWKNADYVKSYADMGYENYKLLLSYYGKYSNIPDTCIDALLSKCASEGSKNTHLMREGLFKVFDKEHIDERCDFVDRCLGVVGRGNGRLRTWSVVLKFVYYCDRIHNELFIERLTRNKHIITPCVTIKQVLECFEEIYNYSVSKKNKIYFIPEYDMYTRKMNGEK